MAWISVTAPNGDKVWLNTDAIVRVHPPVRNEGVKVGTKGVADLVNGGVQYTKESAAELARILSNMA